MVRSESRPSLHMKAVVASTLLASLAQSQCIPVPISIPISNVTVANGVPNAINRGVFISVGTPPQNFAFMPSIFNNSFVYSDANLCKAIGNAIPQESCITIRGGAYSALASNTQKPGDPGARARGESPDGYPSTSIFMDTLSLSDQVKVTNYTFEVPLSDWGEQLYTPQAGLGFGPNSTLLNSLKEQNLIASRSWSIFWGRNGRGQQSNGSLVLGGYDKSLAQGRNYTRKLNYTNCNWGTSVEISYLGLIDVNAKTFDLHNASRTIPLPTYACIHPSYPGLARMPFNDYFSNFVDYSNYSSFLATSGTNSIRSFGYNYYDLLYLPRDARNQYAGDMNFTIAGGPSVRITNDQLISPHIYLDDDTNVWRQNISESDLKIDAAPDVGMFLGRNFMTFAYLMINLDAGEFTLWSAYPDATTQQLQAVDEKNNLIDATKNSCTNTSPSIPPRFPTSTPASATTSASSSTSDPPSPINTGAIAGAVVGGVAGLGLILAGVWFFLRNQKKQKVAAVVPDDPSAMYPYTDKKAELDSGHLTELDAGHISELDAPVPQYTYEVEA